MLHTERETCWSAGGGNKYLLEQLLIYSSVYEKLISHSPYLDLKDNRDSTAWVNKIEKFVVRNGRRICRVSWQQDHDCSRFYYFYCR